MSREHLPFYVFRDTRNGRLWLAGTRLARSGDPPAAAWNTAHFLGAGRSLRWVTERAQAEPFPSGPLADNRVAANGYARGECTVVRGQPPHEPEDVACPFCAAAWGRPCRSLPHYSRAPKRGTYHPERIAAAGQAETQGKPRERRPDSRPIRVTPRRGRVARSSQQIPESEA